MPPVADDQPSAACTTVGESSASQMAGNRRLAERADDADDADDKSSPLSGPTIREVF
jgi:hypothetical protein